ncbi:glutathione S-transferase C-terminal domain-containing protein [Frigidibacter sp. MR17.24]|uniref:glutathione S-transferase C-terminal domain-containing protein n=1 Tax=Frigidibacter sp. MR17.24 TaxID=3127345 RepID=UPI00301308C6
MTDLSAFPITRKWPPRTAGAIQLYSLPTPNGVKVSVMLEECGLAYDAHKVDFGSNDQFSPEFLSLAPNNKIPAILDPAGPDGTPVGLWESGAILIYLGEKTGRFLPAAGAARAEVIQWLMWQMGGLGPMFGQYGFFHVFAGKAIEDPRPRQRFADESRRLLGVLDGRLADRDWVAGDYSIADMAIASWLWGASKYYGMPEALDWGPYPRVSAYLERFVARPAVQRGLVQPPRQ